jgi:biopolymer transport protein ExbD
MSDLFDNAPHFETLESPLDLTSLLDVLFLLLVFLILTAQTAAYVVPVHLPTSNAGNPLVPQNKKTLVITIKPKKWFVDDVPYTTWATFKARLISVSKNTQIRVASDKDVTLQRFMNVLTLMQSQGQCVVDILTTTAATSNGI